MQLLHGDCLKLMNTIPEKSIDLVICDLPYGQTHNQWDSLLPLDILWEHWHRICKDDAPVILFGQGLFSVELIKSNIQEWRYNLVWDKVLVSGFLNAKKMPLRQHEDIIVFYRNTPTYNPQMGVGLPLHSRGRTRRNPTSNCYGQHADTDEDRTGERQKYPTSIIRFSKPHPSVTQHPTEKPVPLLQYLIRTYSNKGDTVLDCTMGVGSTGVAARLEQRDFIGIEKNDNYFQKAQIRISEADGILTLF